MPPIFGHAAEELQPALASLSLLAKQHVQKWAGTQRRDSKDPQDTCCESWPSLDKACAIAFSLLSLPVLPMFSQ